MKTTTTTTTGIKVKSAIKAGGLATQSQPCRPQGPSTIKAGGLATQPQPCRPQGPVRHQGRRPRSQSQPCRPQGPLRHQGRWALLSITTVPASRSAPPSRQADSLQSQPFRPQGPFRRQGRWPRSQSQSLGPQGPLRRQGRRTRSQSQPLRPQGPLRHQGRRTRLSITTDPASRSAPPSRRVTAASPRTTTAPASRFAPPSRPAARSQSQPFRDQGSFRDQGRTRRLLPKPQPARAPIARRHRRSARSASRWPRSQFSTTVRSRSIEALRVGSSRILRQPMRARRSETGFRQSAGQSEGGLGLRRRDRRSRPTGHFKARSRGDDGLGRVALSR